MAAQVCFVFELLDEVTIGASEQTPVKVARIVSRRVGPILGELDGKPVVGAAMNPVPRNPSTDGARAKFQSPKMDINGRRIDETISRLVRDVVRMLAEPLAAIVLSCTFWHDAFDESLSATVNSLRFRRG
jgi:hypothetical protein